MANDESWEKVEQGDTWDFEENKELQGTYLFREENVGANESMLYTFEVGGKNVSVWGSAILDSRLKNLEIGEEVKIVYLGKTKSEKTGRTFKNFEVYHRKPAFSKVDEPEEEENEKKSE